MEGPFMFVPCFVALCCRDVDHSLFYCFIGFV